MGNKLLKSSSLLVFMRLIYRSLGLISMLILARLLVPEDFGIIAIAALFIFFFDVLSNTGIQQYLVQKEEVDDEDINSAWTLDLIIKGVMALLSLAISPLVAIFYDNPQIGYAVAVLSVAIVLRALMNPGLHILRRNLEYPLIFKISVLQKVSAVVVVIAIAYYFKTFWAMIAGDIVSALVGLFLSYRCCAVRPKLSRQRISEQWDFSKWMLSRGFVGYARAQVDILLVSKLFPLDVLGQYNISKDITVMPAFDIIGPAVEPLIATFSKQKNNLLELSRQFTHAFLVILIFVSPICFFLFFHAELVIGVVLGEKWAAAAAITKGLSLMLFAYSVGHILNNVFFALARVKEIFAYDVLSLAAVVIILLSIPFTDIVDFAYWRGAIALVVTFGFLLFAIKTVQCNVSDMLTAIFIPTMTGSIAAVALTHFDYPITLPYLFIVGFLFTALYLALLFFIALLSKNTSAICALIHVELSKYGNKAISLLRLSGKN